MGNLGRLKLSSKGLKPVFGARRAQMVFVNSLGAIRFGFPAISLVRTFVRELFSAVSFFDGKENRSDHYRLLRAIGKGLISKMYDITKVQQFDVLAESGADLTPDERGVHVLGERTQLRSRRWPTP